MKSIGIRVKSITHKWMISLVCDVEQQQHQQQYQNTASHSNTDNNCAKINDKIIMKALYYLVKLYSSVSNETHISRGFVREEKIQTKRESVTSLHIAKSSIKRNIKIRKRMECLNICKRFSFIPHTLPFWIQKSLTFLKGEKKSKIFQQ